MAEATVTEREVKYLELQKNSYERLRIEPKRWKNYDLIDLRVFAQSMASDEWVPTKKGMTFQRSLLPKVIAALRELDVDAEEDNDEGS